MKINSLTRDEFEEWVRSDSDGFMQRIHAPEAFVIRAYYDRDYILQLRQRVFEQARRSEPSWHPLLDGCPDYHRVHDNYAGAHVKSRMHGFYHHGWKPENRELFDHFGDIFRLKCHLAGDLDPEVLVRQIPSQGVVARVNLQHYPRGGGGISEHSDPHGDFALIQTLVQASEPGKDFTTGGLFARETAGGEKHYLDFHTEPGDLMVLSPGIPHGVDAVDPDEPYGLSQNAGKWTILPIFVASDHPRTDGTAVERPQEIRS